jgi:hypothetical protein
VVRRFLSSETSAVAVILRIFTSHTFLASQLEALLFSGIPATTSVYVIRLQCWRCVKCLYSSVTVKGNKKVVKTSPGIRIEKNQTLNSGPFGGISECWQLQKISRIVTDEIKQICGR